MFLMLKKNVHHNHALHRDFYFYPNLSLIQWWQEVRYILFCLITPTNIGQISKPEKVSEFACPEDFETVTGS